MPYSSREKQREHQRKWLAARRASWFKAHGPCLSCSSWDRLELDHVDPAQKVAHNVWSWSEERRAIELAKCQVLCHGCHKAKTKASYPERQHGTDVMRTKTNCHCRLCRAHWAIRSRLRKLRVTKKWLSEA